MDPRLQGQALEFSVFVDGYRAAHRTLKFDLRIAEQDADKAATPPHLELISEAERFVSTTKSLFLPSFDN